MFVFKKTIVLICAVALFLIPAAAAEGQIWEYAIEPQYLLPSGVTIGYGIFADGFAMVQTPNEDYQFIDTKGNRAYPPESWNALSIYSGGENEFVRVYENGAYGFSDKSGNIVIPCQFEYADPKFRKGLGRVTINDKMGVIDTSGNFVIEPTWYSVNFDDRYYDTKVEYFTVATEEGKCGVVDKSGKIVISAVWDYISPWFSEGLACVKQGDKYGFVDFSNNIVIEPQFEFAEGFDSKSGLAKVHVNGLLGWIRLKKSFAANATATAIPTASTILVNGKSVAFDAYKINDNNYFKLRDLAYILSGTAKQFEVRWDAAAKAILLTSGKPYTAIGGEMASKGGGAKAPAPTDSKILLNGTEVFFTAYNIDGNNYFKLRNIGAALNFSVEWDGERNTIVIDTSKVYIEE